MTIRELIQRIGSRGLRGRLRFASQSFDVRIIDCREVFGRVDYLVEPIAGNGVRWVAADSVDPMPEAKS